MNTKQTIVGIVIVILCAISNILSVQISKTSIETVAAPFFLNYFSITWLITLGPFYTFCCLVQNVFSSKRWNDDIIPDLSILGFEGDFSIFQFRKCAVFMVIYVSCNVCYVSGLSYIPSTIATSVMSLDPAFTFLLSLFCLNNTALGWRVNLQQAISALTAAAGVCFIMAGASQGGEQGSPVNETNFKPVEEVQLKAADYAIGVVFITSAAFLAASYKTLYSRTFGVLSFGQCCYSLTFIGLLNLVLLSPVCWFVLSNGYEDISNIDSTGWLWLCAMALTTLMFNLSLNFGVSVTYPLFVSIGLVMPVPANLLVDMYLRGTVFTLFEVIGTILAVCALVILLIPMPAKAKRDSELEEKFIVKE